MIAFAIQLAEGRNRNDDIAPVCIPTAVLIAGIASTRAQDANASFVVSYIEVAPSSARAAAGILRALQDASRKEPGNSGFEVLQRKGQPRPVAR